MHRDIYTVVLIFGDRKVFFASVYYLYSRGSQIKKKLDL